LLRDTAILTTHFSHHQIASNQAKALETVNESNNTNNLRLSKVVDTLNDQIAELNKDKMTLEVTIDGQRAKDRAREGEGMVGVFERERASKEKEIMEAHSNYLQEELDRVRNDHLTYKNSTSTSLINQTSNIESLTLENSRLAERQKVMDARIKETEAAFVASEERIRSTKRAAREDNEGT